MFSDRDDERAMRYPGPAAPRYGHGLGPARRGRFGSLAKWSLIGFNALMGLFVLLPLIIVNTLDNPSNGEVLAGYLGSALLIASAFSFWLVSNIILGVIVYVTRPD